MERADVVIVGGGIIGFSIAYHLLKAAPGLQVLVLEKEAAPGTGATGKATGGIRHQFSTKVNVELTKLSMEQFARFQEEFGVDIGLVRNGYLFVTTQQATMDVLARNAALHQSLGVPTEVLSPADLARVLPAMRSDDLLGGTACWLDGSADPYTAMQGYWQRMRELGGRLVTECEVTGFQRQGDRIAQVETSRGPITCDLVVNAAGPWAGLVGRLAGVETPVQPYRRAVFVAKAMPALSQMMPLTVDMDTGWYMHRENRSGQLLLGGTDKVSHPGFSTAVDWDGLERVLIAGAHRFPVLEKAEVYRSYAGSREITPDFHAIVDRAPELRNFYMACGFSGHGFMHAPAAGMAVAELIVHGEARSIDISPLRLDRFAKGAATQESASF